MRLRFACTLAAGLVAFAGCAGSSNEPPTGDVSGVVTAAGVKLTGGNVKFTPAAGGTPVSANVGYEGTYRASALAPGDYKVTVETAFLKTLAKSPSGIAAAPPEKGTKAAPKLADPCQTYVQVPKKYEKVGETTLTLTVKPGPQTADFDCP